MTYVTGSQVVPSPIATHVKNGDTTTFDVSQQQQQQQQQQQPLSPSQVISTSKELTACLDTQRLFERAYKSLQPSNLFRQVVAFYAERRMHVFFWMHGMATLIVWSK